MPTCLSDVHLSTGWITNALHKLALLPSTMPPFCSRNIPEYLNAPIFLSFVFMNFYKDWNNALVENAPAIASTEWICECVACSPQFSCINPAKLTYFSFCQASFEKDSWPFHLHRQFKDWQFIVTFCSTSFGETFIKAFGNSLLIISRLLGRMTNNNPPPVPPPEPLAVLELDFSYRNDDTQHQITDIFGGPLSPECSNTDICDEIFGYSNDLIPSDLIPSDSDDDMFCRLNSRCTSLGGGDAEMSEGDQL